MYETGTQPTLLLLSLNQGSFINQLYGTQIKMYNRLNSVRVMI